MQNSDYLDLDGRQLRILLTIHEAGSLSTAAKMLDMNQSTVSYWLDLLRKRTGDPLFVRSGNGIHPTERALSLLPKAQEALRNLQAICVAETYDPTIDTGTLHLAGSGVEREFVFASLLKIGFELAPEMNWEITSTGSTFQTVERLRDGPLDFAVMPNKIHEGDGIMQRQVFTFKDAVFFDSRFPLPEDDFDAYCQRPHVRVALGPDTRFDIDRRLEKMGRQRRVALQVNDFDSAMRLLRGTPIIATLPDCLALGYGDEITMISPPWQQETSTVMLYWHARNQTSPRHAFWRNEIAKLGQFPQ